MVAHRRHWRRRCLPRSASGSWTPPLPPPPWSSS
uniref:Uncharacterized protein n=1 Tax=Arundo donax TaxID=35708 RepID=A0A0A9GQI9_ARUDO